MNHHLLLPFTLSAALHAVVLVAVLASRSVEEERSAFMVDIVSGEAAGSQAASGVIAAESAQPVSAVGAVQEVAAVVEASVTAVRPSDSAFAEREIAPQDVSSVAPPQAVQAVLAEEADASVRAEPAAAKALAPPRETTETVRSSRRRQAVAARPVDSRSVESREESGSPASAVTATPVSPEGPSTHVEQGYSASLADASGTSASGGSESAEKGGEAMHRVEPAYPLAARRRGVEGAVVLRVRFDAEGRPEDVVVKTGSGSEMLDGAAREAVRRWRFRGGAAGFVDVPITFRLRGTEKVQITDAGTERSQ